MLMPNGSMYTTPMNGVRAGRSGRTSVGNVSTGILSPFPTARLVNISFEKIFMNPCSFCLPGTSARDGPPHIQPLYSRANPPIIVPVRTPCCYGALRTHLVGATATRGRIENDWERKGEPAAPPGRQEKEVRE